MSRCSLRWGVGPAALGGITSPSRRWSFSFYGVAGMGSSRLPKPLLFCELRREGRGRIHPGLGS